jgi:hypothetical protein
VRVTGADSSSFTDLAGKSRQLGGTFADLLARLRLRRGFPLLDERTQQLLAARTIASAPVGLRSSQ